MAHVLLGYNKERAATAEEVVVRVKEMVAKMNKGGVVVA